MKLNSVLYPLKLLKRIIYIIGKYPLIALLTIQSLPLLGRAASSPDKIPLEKPYAGQRLLLIALYQAGTLREDLKRLLLMAKAKGIYILGINNATLTQPLDAYFDCYIERINAGRDFGSYKTGFQYLFTHQIDKQCPRLLMLNDSIYYDTARLNAFIDDMMESPIEVLGATENYEIFHHMGSFSIAMAARILQHADFHAFWNHYQLSEVRLVVIHRGELALSRCLKQCISAPSQFQALYGLKQLEESLTASPARDMFMQLASHSPYLACSKRPEDRTLDKILSYSRSRSQIHLNAAYLLYMGLPLVKLDGFYRGVFVATDIALICKQLPDSEADELKPLLLRRGFGGDMPFGWKKILYLWGFI